MKKSNNLILRTRFSDRFCHWIVVICFFLVALSGLSWFYPSFSWLSGVLGTPQLARLLHPFLGVVVFLGLLFMFFRFVKYNIPNKTDRLWLSHTKQVILNRVEQPLQVGKYNAGQKILFWLIMLSITVLLVSGLIMWRAYFSHLFSIEMVRWAILVHSIAGIGLMLLIAGHIYLAIWVRGSISGMVTGYVSKSWAKQHHDGWYDELQAEEKNKGTKTL